MPRNSNFADIRRASNCTGVVENGGIQFFIAISLESSEISLKCLLKFMLVFKLDLPMIFVTVNAYNLHVLQF